VYRYGAIQYEYFVASIVVANRNPVMHFEVKVCEKIYCA
jgi:hypothetical protein